MDIDNGFARALIEGGRDGMLEMINSGITADHLQGQGAIAVKFVIDYWKKFDEVPSESVLKQSKGIVLDKSEGHIGYWIEQVKKRAIYVVMRKGLEPVIACLEKYEPEKAFEKNIDLCRQIWGDVPGTAKVESLFSLGPAVKDLYMRIKKGDIGIPTPWEKLTEAILGFWPGDFVVVAARSGIGKTFSMILTARAAWMNGYKVLFVCTEMAKVKIAQRFYSMHLRMNYEYMRKAQLSDFAETKMFEKIDKMFNDENFFVVGDDFEITLDNIEAAVYEIKPHILLVDGVYLVRVLAARDRHSRVSMVADFIKRVSKKYGIVGVASTQFNREVDDDDPETVDISNISITDVLGWNADIVIALTRTGDMKQDGLMNIKVLKMREGEQIEFISKWDFRAMDFGQADEPKKDIHDDELNKDDELFL